MSFSNIKSGDIILTVVNFFLNISSMIITNGKVNHAGIAVWIKNKEIIPMEEEDSQLCILEISNNKTYDIITDTIKSGITITPLKQVIERSKNVYYRPVNDDPDLLFKLKEYYNETKDLKYKLTAKTITQIVLNIGQGENSKEYEYCIPYVVNWLKKLGYQGKPINSRYRSTSLYSPDDLIGLYNQDPVFKRNEIQLSFKTKPIPEWIESLIVYLLICLFLLFIFFIFTKSPYQND